MYAKTLQELTAKKFFEEHKEIRYAAICPTVVIGPML